MKKFKILVDADACPATVKNTVIKHAKLRKIDVYMFVDFNHIIDDGYSKVITVEQGSDSVDFRLLKDILPDDLVITQDYGVAGIALAKRAKVIHPSGMIFNDNNIDGLLNKRFIGQKMRRQGKYLKSGQSHDSKEKFSESFLKILNETF